MLCINSQTELKDKYKSMRIGDWIYIYWDQVFSIEECFPITLVEPSGKNRTGMLLNASLVVSQRMTQILRILLFNIDFIKKLYTQQWRVTKTMRAWNVPTSIR